MQTLIINIKQLVQVRETNIEMVSGADMNTLPVLENAYLLIEDGLISDFGLMNDLPEIEVQNVIDATDKVVMPTWVDSRSEERRVGKECRCGWLRERRNTEI